MSEPSLDVFDYLQRMRELQASDLFLSVGAPAHAKVEGHSQALDERVLGPGEVKQMAYQLLSQKQIAEFDPGGQVGGGMAQAFAVMADGGFRFAALAGGLAEIEPGWKTGGIAVRCPAEVFFGLV